MTLQTPCSLVCTCSNDKCFTDVRTSFFSSLVFPHPNGHSERVHADIPGKATSGRVSRDQKLWGKKIKVVKLLTGIFFHWLLNTCNWNTLCFRSCMVAIRLLLFHKMSSSQRLGYIFLIEIKPSGIKKLNIDLLNQYITVITICPFFQRTIFVCGFSYWVEGV